MISKLKQMIGLFLDFSSFTTLSGSRREMSECLQSFLWLSKFDALFTFIEPKSQKSAVQRNRRVLIDSMWDTCTATTAATWHVTAASLILYNFPSRAKIECSSHQTSTSLSHTQTLARLSLSPHQPAVCCRRFYRLCDSPFVIEGKFIAEPPILGLGLGNDCVSHLSSSQNQLESLFPLMFFLNWKWIMLIRWCICEILVGFEFKGLVFAGNGGYTFGLCELRSDFVEGTLCTRKEKSSCSSDWTRKCKWFVLKTLL